MFLREFVAKPIIGFLAFFTLGIVYFWLAKKQRFARLLQSPLTDSNRRPPPHHALRSATSRNHRQ